MKINKKKLKRMKIAARMKKWMWKLFINLLEQI